MIKTSWIWLSVILFPLSSFVFSSSENQTYGPVDKQFLNNLIQKKTAEIC
jgi:hypothetical protein